MPGQIHSERFLIYGGGASSGGWTCPPMKRAVVKGILAYGETAGSYLYLQLAGRLIHYWKAPAANSSEAVLTSCVFYAGEQLAFQTVGGIMALAVSGFIFDEPSARSWVDPEPAPDPPIDWTSGM